MRILFVTPPPYLPNRLHRMRSFDLIRILAKKHEVHLLSVTIHKEEPKEFEEIKKVCKSVKIIYLNPIKAMLSCLRLPFLPSEVAYCYSEKVTEEIEKTVNKYDIYLLYLKRLRSAIYLMGSDDIIGIASSSVGRRTPRNDRVTVILDTTDAMSMFYFRLYKHATFPKKLFYLLEAIRYKQFEKNIMERMKNWIVCSEIDKKYLQNLGGNVDIHVVPNLVDTNFFSPRRSIFITSKESRSLPRQVPDGTWPRHLRGVANFSPSRNAVSTGSPALDRRGSPKDSSKVELRGEEGNSLLFRGLMDKPVNIDACLFFVKEILPKVKKSIKDIKLFIVGPNPHRLIRKLHNQKDIFVTGFVKDVREFIGRTSISICPVRIGAGIRHKILQAWSMGRPVVSTTIGAEGLLHEKDKNIAIADNAEEFAEQIITLLKNRKKYDKLALNGRETVVKYYSLKAVSLELERVIQNVKGFK